MKDIFDNDREYHRRDFYSFRTTLFFISMFSNTLFRSSRPEVFYVKDALKNPAALFKKRLRHRCFPVNFAKLLRTLPVAAECFPNNVFLLNVFLF